MPFFGATVGVPVTRRFQGGVSLAGDLCVG